MIKSKGSSGYLSQVEGPKTPLDTNEPITPYIIGRELNLRKLPDRQWEWNPQPSEQLLPMTIKTSASTETAKAAYKDYCELFVRELVHHAPVLLSLTPACPLHRLEKTMISGKHSCNGRYQLLWPVTSDCVSASSCKVEKCQTLKLYTILDLHPFSRFSGNLVPLRFHSDHHFQKYPPSSGEYKANSSIPNCIG